MTNTRKLWMRIKKGRIFGIVFALAIVLSFSTKFFSKASETFDTDDALYAWDISDNASGGVMAYFFNGSTRKDGSTPTARTYDHELLIQTEIPDTQMIAFNDCYSGSKGVVSEVNYRESVNLNDTRGYIYDTHICTPWSLLDNLKTGSIDVKTIYIANEIELTDATGLFGGTSVTSIHGLENLDTSVVTSMNSMFYSLHIVNLDLTGLDTSNVENMHDMFNNASFKTIIFGDDFKTNNVTDMSGMFAGAMYITSTESSPFDLSKFNTSKVTNMNRMFAGCDGIEYLNLSNFDTSKVTNMGEMFAYDTELETLILSDDFTTENVDDFDYMFDYMSLECVDLSTFTFKEDAIVDKFLADNEDWLKKIILPESIDASLDIELEAEDGFAWVGYKGGKETDKAYTSLPEKSEEVDNLRLKEVVTVYDGHGYLTEDKIYSWDISENAGDNKILAYYFRDEDNTEKYNGGTLVILDANPSQDSSNPNRMMSFNGYAVKYEYGFVSVHNGCDNFADDTFTTNEKYHVVRTSDFYEDTLATPWGMMDAYNKYTGGPDTVHKVVFANEVHSGGSLNYLFHRLEDCREIDLTNLVVDYDHFDDLTSEKDYFYKLFRSLQNCTIKMFNGCGYMPEAFDDSGSFSGQEDLIASNIVLDFRGTTMDFESSKNLAGSSQLRLNGKGIIERIYLPDSLGSVTDPISLGEWICFKKNEDLKDYWFKVFSEDGEMLGVTKDLLDSSTNFGEANKKPCYIEPWWEYRIFSIYSKWIDGDKTYTEKVQLLYEIVSTIYWYDAFSRKHTSNIFIEEESFNGNFTLDDLVDQMETINLSVFYGDMFDYIEETLINKTGGSSFPQNKEIDLENSDDPYAIFIKAMNDYIKYLHSFEVELDPNASEMTFLDEITVKVKNATSNIFKKMFNFYKYVFEGRELIEYKDITQQAVGSLQDLMMADLGVLQQVLPDDEEATIKYTITKDTVRKQVEDDLIVEAFGGLSDTPITMKIQLELKEEPGDDFSVTYVGMNPENISQSTEVTLTKDDFIDKKWEKDFDSVNFMGLSISQFGVLTSSIIGTDSTNEIYVTITIPRYAIKTTKTFEKATGSSNVISYEPLEYYEIGDYYVISSPSPVGEWPLPISDDATSIPIYYGNTGIQVYNSITEVMMNSPSYEYEEKTVTTQYSNINESNIQDIIESGEFGEAEVNVFAISYGAQPIFRTTKGNFIVIIPKAFETDNYVSGYTRNFTLDRAGENTFGVISKAYRATSDLYSMMGYHVELEEEKTVNANSFTLEKPSSGSDTIVLKVNDGTNDYNEAIGLHVNKTDGAEYASVKLYRINNKGNEVEIPSDNYSITYENNKGDKGTKGTLKIEGTGTNISGSRSYDFNLFENDVNGNKIDDDFEKKIIVTTNGDAAGGSLNCNAELPILVSDTSKEISITVNDGYKAIVKLEGNKVKEISSSQNVNLAGLDQIAGDVHVTVTFEKVNSNPTPPGGGGGGGGGSIVTSPTVTFKLVDDEKLNKELLKTNEKELKDLKFTGNKVDSLPKELKREGYIFDGWYKDKDFKEKVNVGDYLQGKVTLYAKWKEDNKDENFKPYMNGYEDMTFKPKELITREEVATIMARLYDEFDEKEDYKKFNDFEDAKDRWSLNYIGYCRNKNIINGYEDGLFKPTNNMTRAELATLVNKALEDFINLDEITRMSNITFTDVKGKWYEEHVMRLASLEILNGYEDGSFKGDNFVTRIEVAIVMNKLTGRIVEEPIKEEYIKKVTESFKDVDRNSWYFKYVVAATCDLEKINK